MESKESDGSGGVRGEDQALEREAEYLALLVHELRNPLAPLLNACQLITLRGGDRQYRKELGMIERKVREINGILDEVAELSSVVGGLVELALGDVEIAVATDCGLQVVGPLIAERTQRLHVNVPEGLVVRGDVARLGQAIASVLKHAARYCEPGGDIAIGAERSGAQVTVVVTATGKGIAPERFAVLFEPFRQSRAERLRAGGGLGHELPLAQRLIALHGGVVEVANEERGSRVTIRLPAKTQEP